jgi:flagellar basal body-associated protein FliL
MKSCFGMLLTLIVLLAVIFSGATIWYLSNSAEFTRKDAPAPPAAR